MASTSWSRCESYIEKVAEKLGVDYDISPTARNEHLYSALDAQCRAFDKKKSLDASEQEKLKDLSIELLKMSTYPSLQGWVHPEPLLRDFEYYSIMFKASGQLDLCDVRYKPIPTLKFTQEFELSSDNETVMKLKPDVQLRLFT